MDTIALRDAYDTFIATVRPLEPRRPPADEWPAELVLAHVIVVDRLIAQAAAEVLAGRKPRYDNRASQSEPYLRAIAAAAGSWDALVDRVREAGDELIRVAEAVPDELAETLIDVYVLDGDRTQVDGPAPLGRLLQTPARVHLPAHSEQLTARAPEALAGSAI